MRALVALAVLLLAATAAGADQWIFPDLHVGKGYAGPIAFDATNIDGTARAAGGLSGTLTVYRVRPSNGAGGTVLFQGDISPVGTPGNRLACLVTPIETAVPGQYYADVVLTDGSLIESWHGVVIIEGR